MSKPVENLFDRLGSLADREQISLFAVGGYVRDKLLGRPGTDIDLVVLGNGPVFAEKAHRFLNGHGWVTYPKFGTASFLTGGFKLEFVTARAESYEKQSRNPEITPSALEDDLMRRDFTINTLAMSLNQKTRGNVIDLHNGRKDLKAGLIRTPLEPEKTFYDDPLRIMRAARFASQLEFTIDSGTVSYTHLTLPTN